MKVNNLKLNTLLSLLVLISPVFFLTVKHWTNLIVICLFVCCLYVLTKDENLHTIMGDVLTSILTAQANEQIRTDDSEEFNL